MQMKTVTILGSTGSIGRQTLEVVGHLGLQVKAITAYNNKALFEQQIAKYSPQMAVLGSKPGGDEAIIEAARCSDADVIVTAIAGEAGLNSTLAAVKTGRRVALANKEALVCGGETVMALAREYGTEIIPVDSEHSAVFQCLAGAPDKEIKKIILTASGGPFLNLSAEELEKVTPEMALCHPNWSMGQKVTIDSATMMNKGLEFIEAMHLFGLKPAQIEVVIHPESIVHSMVEFTDGSVMAQMSNPDMRMPIQYALTYPRRLPGLTKPLDLTALGSLTFRKPDMEKFPCLGLAFKAAAQGADACRALNSANERAVESFISGSIAFTDIPKYIEKEMECI